jgi:hypothetical protein
MYHEDYKQLSLMAEDVDECCDYCDWSIDTNPSPEQQRSIERVLDYFHDGGQTSPNSALHHGGQPQTRILSMEGNGGQIKNCPPNSALHHGGQNKKRLDPVGSPDHGNETRRSIFDRHRGDDGTWIEKQNRKTGIFEYLRWRELDGTKRAKYLGKLA